MRARVSQTRGQKTALMKATSSTRLSLKGGAGEEEEAAWARAMDQLGKVAEGGSQRIQLFLHNNPER